MSLIDQVRRRTCVATSRITFKHHQEVERLIPKVVKLIMNRADEGGDMIIIDRKLVKKDFDSVEIVGLLADHFKKEGFGTKFLDFSESLVISWESE